MTEDELREANGLVARYYATQKDGRRKYGNELYCIRCRLRELGVHVKTPTVETAPVDAA